jgi:trk system potassium uptake protein TrkH
LKINFAHPASVLVLSFLAVIALGTVLLMLPLSHAGGEGAPLLTALFTATSAVCVTGLVVVDTGTYWSSTGQVIIMGLFQLGGFGMMTSATLMGLLISGQMRLRTRLLLQAETHSLALGDVKSVAKLVLWVTLAMELAATTALTLRFALGYGMPWDEAAWHGLFHAVSAFNNAGFSTWGDSVMRFVGDAFVLGPLMVAIIVGGLGFPVLHELMVERGSRRPQWSMHAVLTVWGSIALIVAGTLIIFLAEMNNPKTLAPLGWSGKGLAALFTSVSARTAGFNAIDIGGLNTESQALHYTLMFIGGGSAGTAGGVKVTTFFVLVLVVWNEIRGHRDVEFRGRRIATSVQRQALTVLTLSAAMVSLAVLLILPLTPLPYEKVLFEVISAFGTVGLSTGITADLVPGAQAIIIALMFIGRVGVVTLAVALATNQMRRNYRYPEETPIVG